jgi:hypothetical protein
LEVLLLLHEVKKLPQCLSFTQKSVGVRIHTQRKGEKAISLRGSHSCRRYRRKMDDTIRNGHFSIVKHFHLRRYKLPKREEEMCLCCACKCHRGGFFELCYKGIELSFMPTIMRGSVYTRKVWIKGVCAALHWQCANAECCVH